MSHTFPYPNSFSFSTAEAPALSLKKHIKCSAFKYATTLSILEIHPINLMHLQLFSLTGLLSQALLYPFALHLKITVYSALLMEK